VKGSHDGTSDFRSARAQRARDRLHIVRARWAGAFSRTLSLPAGVDTEKVKATFRNGVLEIHLPKAEKAKGKTIEIKAASRRSRSSCMT
jgi:HSP20 family molecular chaperone IbpA